MFGCGQVREFGYSDEALWQMVQWNSFTTLTHRGILLWLGHVARMNCDRLPKMAGFGWLEGLEEHRSARYTFPSWVQWLLAKYDISVMDWFRLAQKPTKNWIRLINQALPRTRLSSRQCMLLDSWKAGDPVLQWSTQAASNTAAPPKLRWSYSVRLVHLLPSMPGSCKYTTTELTLSK